MSNTMENPDGSKSSRRRLGAILIVGGFLLVVAGFVIDRYPPWDILLLVLGCGSSLVGLTTFDHWFKTLKK